MLITGGWSGALADVNPTIRVPFLSLKNLNIDSATFWRIGLTLHMCDMIEDEMLYLAGKRSTPSKRPHRMVFVSP